VTTAGGSIVRELGPHQAAAAYLPPSALQGLQRNPHIEYIEIDAIRRLPVSDGALRHSHGAGGPGARLERRKPDGLRHRLGVLPGGNVGLYILRVFNDSCLWTFASDLIDALDRCESAGAKVVSMSLGGGLKSRTEERAFKQSDNRGVLSVAAAGNDGSGSPHYPASYRSVLSVGAVDSSMTVASFSQRSNQVELAAPGVGVLSTVPWIEENSLTVGGISYAGNHIENAARTDGNGVGGSLADGGLCTSSGSWNGQVVLCERGSISFFDKVMNVQAVGGTGAVIYNNAAENFFGTLGDGNSSNIPAISLSQESPPRVHEPGDPRRTHLNRPRPG
jgi:hypothetical protein